MSLYHYAVVRKTDGILSYQKVKTPCLKPDSILVRLKKVGICGTDLQIISGLRNEPARVLGHEGVGEVIKVGKNVEKKFNEHDMVTFLPQSFHNPNKILGHNREGLFQEKCLMCKSDIEEGLVIKVDSGVSTILIPLAEPLGTVIYSYSLIKQKIVPKNIVIFGAGQIGMLYALYLNIMSPFFRVILVHNNRSRLEWAIQQQIIQERNALLLNDDLEKNIFEITNQNRVDCAIISTSRSGAITALERSLNIVKHGGCIDLFAGFDKSYRVPELSSCHPFSIRQENICGSSKGYFFHGNFKDKEIFLTGHRGLGAKHIYEAFLYLKSHEEKFKKIITHTLPLSSVADFLNSYRVCGKKQVDGKEWVKAIIDLDIQNVRDNFVLDN